MKIISQILFLILFLNLNIQAQITGQIFDEIGGLPLVKVQLTKSKAETETDFDGNFSIEFSKGMKKTDILLKSEIITLEIRNINLKNKSKIDLGKFIMPSFKTISLKEYENLSETNKENCKLIHCWGSPIGYTLMEYDFENELSINYIVWNYGEIEKHISDFVFNKLEKTISIEWKNLFEKE